MGGINYKDQHHLDALVCESFSEWSEPVRIDQAMINEFAELTGDKLWIHTDPERCKAQSPFKTTIAHGFLLLCLLPKMPCGEDVTRKISGHRQIMNYGSDKLRFLNPVPVDSAVHARNRVAEVRVGERSTKITLESQIKVVGQEKLSLLYHLTLVLM